LNFALHWQLQEHAKIELEQMPQSRVQFPFTVTVFIQLLSQITTLMQEYQNHNARKLSNKNTSNFYQSGTL